MGVVTACDYQKEACDTEPPKSDALGFVYVLGTSCMPVSSGYGTCFTLPVTIW